MQSGTAPRIPENAEVRTLNTARRTPRNEIAEGIPLPRGLIVGAESLPRSLSSLFGVRCSEFIRIGCVHPHLSLRVQRSNLAFSVAFIGGSFPVGADSHPRFPSVRISVHQRSSAVPFLRIRVHSRSFAVPSFPDPDQRPSAFISGSSSVWRSPAVSLSSVFTGVHPRPIRAQSEPATVSGTLSCFG